jgi:hypothetical protein
LPANKFIKAEDRLEIKKNNLTSNRKKVKLLLKYGYINWANLLVHFWEWTKATNSAGGAFSAIPGLANKKLIEKR